MRTFHRIPALRWVVPAAVAALIIGGGAAIGTVTAAHAAAPLPARSAAQLVSDVHSAALTGLSGTVVQTSDLGIPDLPTVGTAPLLGGMGSSSLSSLISGTHTLRLWYAGPEQVRVALLGSLGESDVIRNGTNLWIWSSKDNTAIHRTLPAVRGAGESPLGAALPANPQQAADRALAMLSPSTQVSTEPGVTVAGRSAYELVLRPKDTRSLVASVRIAIDSVHHVPLRVQVFAKGQHDPAFSVGFTSVDFSRPDAAEFAFNPPPGAIVNGSGATVTRRDPATAHGPGVTVRKPGGTPGSASPATPSGTTVVGRGWTTVLVTSAADVPGQLSRVVGALPRVSGTWGTGRLLRTHLFSAVITDRGRVAIGAVTPDLLYAALAAR